MRVLFLPILALIFGSCGGEGVSNRAPVIADPGALTVLEGATAIATINASDPDNDSLTFTISSGDDQALFSVTSTGVLSFSAAPDFETPDDTGSDNVYDLTVQVSDDTLTDTQSIRITVSDAFEGRVVDAPISEASVFVDLNGNNEQDAGEPSGLTDAAGFFKVKTFALPETCEAKVISRAGTDSKTGVALQGFALIADIPNSITKSAYVTPLTTLVASVCTAEAKAEVLAAIGIDKTPGQLLTTDHWAAAESGDDTAKATQRLNQKLGLLLQTAATVAAAGNELTDISVSLAKSVAAEISAVVTSSGGIDLTSAATLTTVLTSALAEVLSGAEVEAMPIAVVAQSVAAVNSVIADPILDPLSDLSTDIIRLAQDELQASVTDVVSSAISVAAFQTATDTTQLFTTIDAVDTDRDGVADVFDRDDDADGVRDSLDAFPFDPTETEDLDADGIGDNVDDFVPGNFDQGSFDKFDWS